MWIVFDFHATFAYGPFNSREEAVKWMNKKKWKEELYVMWLNAPD